ncbi:hypothetical protein ACLM5H_15695 [Fredinandcohnia humi]
MSEKERLGYLLSYHHNLTLQLQTELTSDGRTRLSGSLVMLEEEIDSLLFNKTDFS